MEHEQIIISNHLNTVAKSDNSETGRIGNSFFANYYNATGKVNLDSQLNPYRN